MSFACCSVILSSPMSRQIPLMRFLNIAASLALCYGLRSLKSESLSRHNMTLTYDEGTARTVLGFLETPGDSPLHVIDVAQTEYPKGREGPLKFAFIADEYELRAFDNPFIKEIARTADGTTVSPPPLKAHLLRELGSEVLEGYIDKFNHNKVLYCKLGAFARGWNLPKFTEVRLMFLADFEAHLSRKSSNDPFVLKAMKAEILEQDPGAGWPANPKLCGNRVRELLSGSRRAIPLIGEKAEDTCKRQLQFYSEYISPPAPGIYPDTWPLLKRMHPRSMDTPQHVKNIFNWLTNGTMKPKR